ncbi:glycogen synthase [Leptospira sp. 201903075]|uniref:glycogen/starch synthase n=1 Tax=Leptospira chreensis TaxID=2810035 RepID=UPI00196280AD|nr:glycogen/starch synthase [Leptospira chreensis]MBM9592431.1 glycogen synthase [Leptospira chreensis]MBM9592737.1 glycogen synthase [Leptospira chreensis]
MKILHASAEYFPYIKMGGLADMLASLTKEQAKTEEVYVALPLIGKLGKPPQYTGKVYPALLPQDAEIDSLVVSVLKTSRFLEAKESGVTLYFFQSDLFQTLDSIYGHKEEHFRFAMFSYACYALSQILKVDVFHAHDWHTALSLALQKDSAFPIPTVFTIHNLAYQGDHPFWMTGFLKEEPFRLVTSPFDHDGKCNYMKAGILSANQITTVSPGYREETLAEPNGFGLSYCLNQRAKDYSGILNGIDTDEWNPKEDKRIDQTFSDANWKAGKLKNKTKLFQEIGRPLMPLDAPLVGLIGRLTYQKGYPTFLKAVLERLHLPHRYVVLGSGDPETENAFSQLSESIPDVFYFYKGYNESLAHKIEAASDFFLMPSLFEPCGLNQMYSHAYGTIPIVSRVGGLRDTVEESSILEYKTGIVFEPNDVSSLGYALERAKDLFFSQERDIVVKNIMNLDWSWEKRKIEYQSVYSKAIELNI